MKVQFSITIEVDGKHSKTTSKGAVSNMLATVVNKQKYNRDVATAAHLLICYAVGLAGSVGVPVENILTLRNPNTPEPEPKRCQQCGKTAEQSDDGEIKDGFCSDCTP